MLYLCDFPFPERPRWLPGDQFIRKPIRKLLEPFRGRPPGGLRKVTENLCLGLKRLEVPFLLLRHESEVPDGELLGLLHGPRNLCERIAKRQPCITGPGILNGSREWPDLFETTRCLFHIQNCDWAAEMYKPRFEGKIKVWTMGIDEERYLPSQQKPRFDFLIYDKIRWRDNPEYSDLLAHCQSIMEARGLSVQYIRYGKYPGGKEAAYHEMLSQSRAMLYLSENETQGFAYNEAMSMNVPILAWDIGKWCDPMRFDLGRENAKASSVPYFDSRCGMKFRGVADFEVTLDMFFEKLGSGEFHPREYVLENLRLCQGAQRYRELFAEAAKLIGGGVA